MRCEPRLIAQIDAPPSDSLLDLPARATSGVPSDLAIWLALATGLFALAAIALGQRFAVSVVKAGNASAPARAARNGIVRRLHLRSVAATLRRKEWRLLGRDPWLLSQIFMQIVYTLPISIVIWRSQGYRRQSRFVSCTCHSGHRLTSIGFAGLDHHIEQDAPEFLMTAPITRPGIERAKLEAIALPLFLFLAVPVSGLAIRASHRHAHGDFRICAAVSTALLNLWHPMPGKRGRCSAPPFAIEAGRPDGTYAVIMLGRRDGAGRLPKPRRPRGDGVAMLLLFLNRPGRKQPRPHAAAGGVKDEIIARATILAERSLTGVRMDHVPRVGPHE